MKAYEALSRVYDRLNADVDYEAFADLYEAVFRQAGIAPELVLDLGCGTGTLTLALAKRGYDMIGVDGSAEMLSQAYQRKYEAGADNLLFLQQDMCSFELYGTVGAVVSSLDCVNYLTGDGDLGRCFALVHNYLDPDGVFIFDVNTPYKFKHVYGDNAYILEDEGEDGACYCGWQNEYDEKTALCSFYLSVFAEGEDGRYRRFDEEQTERCYTAEELTAALMAAGFGDVHFYGSTTMDAPDEETERWFVTARCKK
ncbi:MAG: class I SAM-dependent methyltransferase [Clostridia bacterium]|nr:class I SAM-dependent methyltransferase [Clostridia bacterium]MBQ8339055.1 class I SAM-dependent methyltransferase [Clostridia bacterium]